MKSTALWALILLNLVLLGALAGRSMKPNAAVAQAVAGRPGDYTVIPVDFTGAATGSVVILDNVTGQMSAIMTNETTGRMEALPRVNIAELFDAAAGRPPRTPRR
ncbi:MAG TPA: hypothetical protein VF595_07685 [Tepidisphaeraceae bacterium]|jgi:hypothetical protein